MNWTKEAKCCQSNFEQISPLTKYVLRKEKKFEAERNSFDAKIRGMIQEKNSAVSKFQEALEKLHIKEEEISHEKEDLSQARQNLERRLVNICNYFTSGC